MAHSPEEDSGRIIPFRKSTKHSSSGLNPEQRSQLLSEILPQRKEGISASQIPRVWGLKSSGGKILYFPKSY